MVKCFTSFTLDFKYLISDSILLSWNKTTNNKCGNNQVEETKVSSDVNAKQHGKTEDDPSEGVNPVSTEDSDSSAKSGKENDDDEFNDTPWRFYQCCIISNIKGVSIFE